MIHVTIYQNRAEECVGFQAEGHAGYGEEGQDIVCAAASILMINTINAVKLYAEDDFSSISNDDLGVLVCHLRKSPSKEADLLFKAMILGLRQMADDENYAEYIDLTFEEV